MTDVAGPGHLGDVDQSLDPLLQLHEGAVVGDRHNLAAHPRADRIAVLDVRPGVRQQLLQSQRDALPVPVDVQHLDIEAAPDRHHLGRMADAAPGHVGDVKQSVQTAQIDEGAEVGDVLHHPLADLSGQKLLHQCGALLLPLALEDHPARHDDVAAALVELDDHELVGLADQVLDVGDPSQRDLRAREEGVDAHDVDGHTALDLAGQEPLDRPVVLVRVLDELPDAQEVRLLLRQDNHPVFVLKALEEDFHLLARLDLARVLEFVERDGTLTLEAELEDDGGLGDSQHSGLDDLSFANIAARGPMLVEHGLEVVPGDVEDFFAEGIVDQLRRDLAGKRLVRGRGVCRQKRAVVARLGFLILVHRNVTSASLALQETVPAWRVPRGKTGLNGLSW